MFKNYRGKTANIVWKKIASDFRKEKDIIIQDSRLGKTRELLHVTFNIEDPKQRWIIARTPPINPAFSIAEIVWIMNGRNDSKFLNYWNTQLPKFAGSGNKYYGAYGYRLRYNFNIDQLNLAYNTLKKNPTSRQVVLQIWDPKIDLPFYLGKPRNPDIPCNLCSLLKVRNNKLEWLQILRSNDLFLGLPYNIIQFTTLQEIVAGWLNLELGQYHQMSDSLHVYENNLNTLDLISNSGIPMNTDTLAVDKRFSEKLFKELSQKIDIIIKKQSVDERIAVKLLRWEKAPPSFYNLLLVIVAEATRRSKIKNLHNKIMDNCTNQLLLKVWNKWITRLSAIS